MFKRSIYITYVKVTIQNRGGLLTTLVVSKPPLHQNYGGRVWQQLKRTKDLH